MGGTLGAKSFPWPTAIGNSPNVSPLVAPQVPMQNGQANNGGAPIPGTPPTSPLVPGGQSGVSRPGPVTLPQVPAFYAS